MNHIVKCYQGMFIIAANQHRLISEGSCDTEDWSNDALHHRNKLHFKIENYFLNCNNITQYSASVCYCILIK